MKRVAVVGGGIAGLVCAHLLLKRNVDVRLYEASSELGGRIRELAVGDSYVSLGAKTMTPSYSNLIALIREMGLGGKIVKADGKIGIFTGRRLIKLGRLSILFDSTVSPGTKLGLIRFKRYLDGLRPDSLEEDLLNTSLEAFLLKHYPRGVVEDFVKPFVRAFFADSPENISALSGLRLISSSLVNYELAGGFFQLVQAMESKLGMAVMKGAKVNRVSTRADGTFSVERDNGSESADVVVCCVPVPDLRRMVEGISYPEVTYVSKMAFAVEGVSRYPGVGEIVNGDPEFRLDVIHFRGRLATVSSLHQDPDFSPFFKSANILAAHRWEHCSPRSAPGSSPPKLETEIPHLYKSGDLVYGGGLESSCRAGMEAAQLVMSDVARS